MIGKVIKKSIPKDSWWTGIVTGLAAAGIVTGGLLLGGTVGWLLDRAVATIAPWGMLAGLLLGLMLGSWQALRQLRNG